MFDLVVRCVALKTVAVAACLLGGLCSSVGADDVPAPDDEIRQRTKFAGLRRFKPGAWGVAGVELVNPRDEPAEIVTGLYFDGDPLSRFSRKAWIPANSIRTTWFPVRPADDLGSELRSRPFLYDAADDARVLLKTETEQFLEADQLPLVEPPVTAIVGEWAGADSDALQLWRETAVAMRLNMGQSPRIARLTADEIPAFPLSLEAADHVILVGNELADAPTGLETLRAYVHRGGRLWIPLDRVDLRTVDLLLGAAARITPVDRVSLPEFQIHNVLRDRPSGPRQEFDEPVDLVRVLASDVVVSHEVDGWPAAFWQDVGSGRVMFTTLGARAWIRPRRPEEQNPQTEMNSLFVAQQPLVEVTAHFTRTLSPPPLTPPDFSQFLQQQVGYRILGRGSVLTVLGLFCAVVIGLGFMFQRSARLERLLWVGPVVALSATAPLILSGEHSRRAVPPTVAVSEIVHVGPDATTTHSTGLAAVYVPKPTAAEISSHRGALVIPPREQTEGTVRQMVWTDFDQWHWENLELPSGLHLAIAEQHKTVAQPIRATGTFGPEGLRGVLQTGPYSEPSDALIATQTQHMLAVRLDAGGRFTAGKGDLLQPGTYFAGRLLTDAQRRRQTVYEPLLQSRQEFKYPDRPMLLVWTRPRESDLVFPTSMQRTDSALLAIPLEILPPAPGSDVFVPSPFVPFEPVTDAEGNVTTAYDRRTRQWRETSAPTDTLLRFLVPAALLPFEPVQGKLFVSLRAPLRTVRLSTGAVDELVPLEPLEDAVGDFEFTLQQPSALQLDEEGALHIRLQVGELAIASTSDSGHEGIDRTWKLDHIRLELTGRTVERSD